MSTEMSSDLTCQEYNRLVKHFAQQEYAEVYPIFLESEDEEAIDYLSVNLTMLGYDVKRRRVDTRFRLEVTL